MSGLTETKAGRSRRRGSSLIEMMMAVLILATVMIGLASAMVIFKGTMMSKEDAGARQIALNELERLEAIKLTAVTAANIRSPQGIYTVTKTVVPASITTVTASADVTITVAWGGSRSIALKREVSSSGWQNVGTNPAP